MTINLVVIYGFYSYAGAGANVIFSLVNYPGT